MGILAMIIIGAAAGFIATRIMGLDLGVVPTVAIGVLGALVGGWIIRFLLSMVGAAAGIVGAVLGAIFLIWIYQRYLERR